MLLYRLDASFVDLDPRNKRFDVRRIWPQMLRISRTNVLPVSLATLGDFQAAVQYLLAFDQFSTKPLELLTVCECDQVVGFAIDVNVDEERLFLLDPSQKTSRISECRTRSQRTKVANSVSR